MTNHDNNDGNDKKDYHFFVLKSVTVVSRDPLMSTDGIEIDGDDGIDGNE